MPYGLTAETEIGALEDHGFIAATMNLAVVAPAHRHGELIAHFSPERAMLRETQMMGIREFAVTNDPHGQDPERPFAAISGATQHVRRLAIDAPWQLQSLADRTARVPSKANKPFAVRQLTVAK